MGGDRSRVPIGLAALVGALVLGCALPSLATARQSTHLFASVHVKGTSRYRIHVDAWRARSIFIGRREPHRGKVTVSVSDRKGATYTTYTTPAKFNRHRLRADLGPFGRIALHFRETRFGPPPPKDAAKRDGVCEQAGVGVLGKFRGVFRFRGEHGYIGAKARRLHGIVGRNGPLRCHGRDHAIELVARSGQTKFTAFDDTDFGVTLLGASSKELVGGVTVHRKAFRGSAAVAGEFTFNSELTSAAVAPAGPPLSGSASFASPSSWTGSLAVSFLGGENVPLAGPGYKATLKRVTVGKRALRQEATAPRALSAAGSR